MAVFVMDITKSGALSLACDNFTVDKNDLPTIVKAGSGSADCLGKALGGSTCYDGATKKSYILLTNGWQEV